LLPIGGPLPFRQQFSEARDGARKPYQTLAMDKFLTPDVEPQKYREKAAECRRLAAATDHLDVRNAYLDLALAHETFAERIEEAQRSKRLNGNISRMI
jgi:hypothetical protein